MKFELFKIYNPVRNEFSRGGTNLSSLWGKRGKSWNGLNHVKNHINLIANQYVINKYDGEYLNNVVREEARRGWPYKNCLLVKITPEKEWEETPMQTFMRTSKYYQQLQDLYGDEWL